MKTLRIGTPALSASYEIGGASGMDMKPTLYESLLGYQLEPYNGGIQGAAIRRADRFVGRLAESWTVSDDGRTIDMTLREGVRSVAGNELSAQDVKYTLDRGFHVPGYYKWTAQVGGLASNDDVRILDKRTVRFQLATPSAFFLDTRVFPMNGIFDSALVQSHATAGDPWAEQFVAAQDAGFGPYTLEDIVPGKSLVYRARADYYRGKPAFDRLEYAVIPDAMEREARLASGELDHALGLGVPQLLRLQDLPHLHVVFGPSTSVYHLSLQCRNTGFEDVHLRRAVAYAVPYNTILRDVMLDAARPWKSFIPPVVEGYDDHTWPYTHDLAKARAELAEATVPAGFRATILVSSASPADQAVATLIAESLESIGLPSGVEALPVRDLMQRRHAGDYVAMTSGAGPMVPDAGYQLSHDYCTYSEGNDFGYSNPEVDALVEKGLGTLDKAERLGIYAEAIRLLAADIPVVPIASPGFGMALNRRVAGAAWYPDQVLHYGELVPAD